MYNDTILVLRGDMFGHEGEQYAEAIRQQLDGWEVVYPESSAHERELLGKARVVTGAYLDPDDIPEGADIELFAYTFTGTDYLPLDSYAELGITVTNASGVPAPNIAEHVIGSMVVGARDFQRAWRQQQQNVYRSFHTKDINEATVTIVGLGSIGEAVVERLNGFNVTTIGVRHTPSKSSPTDRTLGYDDIELALDPADFVILTCPHTDTTTELIDDDALQTMPPESVLINVSRGGVVDTAALTKRLQRNHIGYAILDVTEPEPLPNDHTLWDLDNAFITPHYAGQTPSYVERLAELVVSNIDWLSDGDLINQID